MLDLVLLEDQNLNINTDQSVRAVEYTNWISPWVSPPTSLNERPRFDIKLFDGEPPIFEF